MKKYLLLLAFSFCLEGFGYFTLLRRIEPFCYFFFITSWWSYIVLADTVLAFRRGTLSVLNTRLPLMVLISCGYWCIFEMLNVRLGNWHYVELPGDAWIRYGGYILSFGTVIPALYLTDRLLRCFMPAVSVKPRTLPPRFPVYTVAAGLLCLLLPLLFPVIFFPLAWVFLALVMDGFNYRRGYDSFARDLEKGSLTALLAAMGAGFICGLIWEGWNYHALSKWIYTVPFVEGPKVFEMPLPGYIGFPAFGIETATFYNFLKGIQGDRVPLYVPAAAAFAFSLSVFPFIDSYTVLSLVISIFR